MSHTNKYIVSTVRNYINRVAIVSSGNTKGAVTKFLFHIHPESIHCEPKKISKHNNLTMYTVDDPKGVFNVAVRKINITEDFIPIEDILHLDKHDK